jgi:alpha-L-rhamnosidase
VEGGKFIWRIAIPANTTATVSVPLRGEGAVNEGAAPADTAVGVKFLRREPGYAVYEVGAGAYTFTTDWK